MAVGIILDLRSSPTHMLRDMQVVIAEQQPAPQEPVVAFRNAVLQDDAPEAAGFIGPSFTCVQLGQRATRQATGPH